VLSAAIQAKADYIVSGDKDLLTLKTFNNVEIVNAALFVKIMEDKTVSDEDNL
jgi:predicted nucleic acid-binding protein